MSQYNSDLDRQVQEKRAAQQRVLLQERAENLRHMAAGQADEAYIREQNPIYQDPSGRLVRSSAFRFVHDEGPNKERA